MTRIRNCTKFLEKIRHEAEMQGHEGSFSGRTSSRGFFIKQSPFKMRLLTVSLLAHNGCRWKLNSDEPLTQLSDITL